MRFDINKLVVLRNNFCERTDGESASVFTQHLCRLHWWGQQR
jgi:hypothetical protein